MIVAQLIEMLKRMPQDATMKLFTVAKDGGPESPVDAFFVFEIKRFASIALLRFNVGAREAFHTHAFHALTWFIHGNLVEQDIDGNLYTYRRSIFPKFTSRSKNHRVLATTTSWCFTIRGPWSDYWTETLDNQTITLTHGRKVVDKD